MATSARAELWRPVFTRSQCKEAERRVREILHRLQLELHPEKTKRVELSWGNYFRTGNASIKFQQIDAYVGWRLHRFMVKRTHGLKGGLVSLRSETS